MSKLGQTRVVEAILSLIAIALLFMVVNRVSITVANYSANSYLREQANEIFALLHKGNLLISIVYGQYGYGYPDLAKKILDSIVPSDIGYNFTVYRINKDGDIERIYSISGRGYNSLNAYSSSYILTGYNGIFEPRLVVLSLSKV